MFVVMAKVIVWLDVSANCCVNVFFLPSFLTCEEMGLTKVDTKKYEAIQCDTPDLNKQRWTLPTGLPVVYIVNPQ